MAWRWHNGSWTIFHLSISDALFRHTKSMLSWTIKPSLGAGHCTQQAMCTPFQTQFTAVSVRIISGTLVGACVGLCKQMPPNSRERAFLEILTRAVEAAHARNLRRADLRQNSTNLAPLAVPVAVPQVAPGAVRAVLVSLSLAAVAARGLAAMSSIHQKHPTRPTGHLRQPHKVKPGPKSLDYLHWSWILTLSLMRGCWIHTSYDYQ